MKASEIGPMPLSFSRGMEYTLAYLSSHPREQELVWNMGYDPDLIEPASQDTYNLKLLIQYMRERDKEYYEAANHMEDWDGTQI